MIVSPSPESLKRPFQLETDFIFWPFDLRCLVVEAAAEPMEREVRAREGEKREVEVEVEVEGEAKGKSGPRAAVPVIARAALFPQRRRLLLEKRLLLAAVVGTERHE